MGKRDIEHGRWCRGTEGRFLESERCRPLSTMTTSTSHVSRVAARIAYVVTRPWLQITGVLVAIVVTLWSFDRVPNPSWQPALLGLAPWIIGKYILCPLRWHALSTSGKTRRWH